MPKREPKLTANLPGRYEREAGSDSRTPYQRDRDRVLYAAAFARLAEITQVISPDLGYVFHNRLTHSLKVAQVARRIAERVGKRQQLLVAKLGGLDPDAAEAAGLAHDLGHPPFGHIAEQELDSIVRGAGVSDGYEGNAQSFRIVVRLAISDARDSDGDPLFGLNWTRQTLDGILKYPWAHGENENVEDKWGYYQTEKAVFDWVRRERPKFQRSLVAEVMDWADDITYAIHDLTDFFQAGRIPIDRFKGNSRERVKFLDHVFRRKPKWKSKETSYTKALDSIIDIFPFEPEERYEDTEDHRARMYGFTTSLIAPYVAAIRLRSPTSEDNCLVSIEPEARLQVNILKQFIWEYIIEDRNLALPQQGQRKAIRTVFRKLLLGLRKESFSLFAEGVRDRLPQLMSSKPEQVRFVADYISGMTEKEVLRLHRELGG